MPEKPPEHRRPDPLRREPPTLDLKAKEVKPAADTNAAGKPAPDKGPAAKPAPAAAKPVPTKPAPAPAEKLVAAAPAAAKTAAPSAATPAASAASAATVSAPKPQAAAAASDVPVRRRPMIDGGVSPIPASTLGGASGSPSVPPIQANAAAAKAPAAASSASATPPRPAGAPAASATASAAAASAASAAKPAAEPAKSAPATEPPKAAPVPPAPVRRGAGFGTVLTTGLLGGLIGAGIVYGVDHYMPELLPNRAGQSQNVDARLAALEQRVSSAPAASGDNAALDRRLVALESANRSLSEQIAARPAAASGSSAPQGQASGDLAGRVAALEDAAKQTGGNGQAIAELRSQLGSVKTSIDDQIKQSGAAAQTSGAALAELTSRVSALQSQSAAQAQAANTAVQAMQGRLGDDEKKLASLSDQLAKFGPASAQAGLRVIVAGRVTDALRDGQPLGPLIDTARRIGAPDDTLAPLQPYAQSAAPTPAALEQDFEPLGRRMIEAARGPATSIGDRLLRMADRIVTVRDAGETAGSDVPALVQRIEAALGRGALGDAVAAWDALPDTAKSSAGPWGARLKQRAAAGEAARRLSTESLSAIDASLR